MVYNELKEGIRFQIEVNIYTECLVSGLIEKIIKKLFETRKIKDKINTVLIR